MSEQRGKRRNNPLSPQRLSCGSKAPLANEAAPPNEGALGAQIGAARFADGGGRPVRMNFAGIVCDNGKIPEKVGYLACDRLAERVGG
ncbi:MAG: hypothetical protein Kow0099_05100 [Candidatus Abyssubacteria bacterium]